MEIAISSHRREILPMSLQRGMYDKAKRAFARLEHLIRRLELRVEDINGPKGGVCKRCLAIMRLSDGNTVAVEQLHEASGGALSRAIDLARQQLARHKNKKDRAIKDYQRQQK